MPRQPAWGLVLGVAAALHAGPAAAEPEPRHVLAFAGGLGFTWPYQETVPGSGSGGYGQVDYGYRLAAWFTPGLYAGVLVTRPQADCGTNVQPCDISSSLVFLGGKVRLMAPIPYVGPFIELGLGASAGRFSTRSGSAVDVASSAVAYHVPFALGLAVGGRHEYELSLQYLYHPRQAQFSGMVGLGLGFALD